MITLLLISCQNDVTTTPFVLRKDTQLQFLNALTYTESFNPYTYRNFYNGGGVSLGDINNDGWIDVYFTGNLVGNKLFLNKGNWLFEDITIPAGVGCENVWSTGANMVDVNGDGWLDIYVCKGGNPEGERRYNELFINNGDLTFTEESEKYNLNIKGLSIQSAFFDYDKDGDLDCYLLNNSTKSVGGFDLKKDQRLTPSENGNMLLRNDNGRFTNVSQESGIYTSDIGFGLGITLSDFNSDSWPDIYISNDFYERDYLYINNQDGSFSEKGDSLFQCFPLGSMGADVGDLDNDLLPDLMITEMFPSTTARKKTKQLYESWKKYQLAHKEGYHHQFPRNMLQRNLDASGFLEVGRFAGVEATDWSWSCLMQDFDNDGLKDIFISNGIYKDLLDRDYLTFIGNDANVKKLINTSEQAIMNLIDSMPSQAIPNAMFKNKGGFEFENVSRKWGLDQNSFSNGCAYGDLDNDGDLDLIVNNANMPSFVYENTIDTSTHRSVSIRLQGEGKNKFAIGAKVILYFGDQSIMHEQFPSRGFQSSVSNILNFGVGNNHTIDSILVIWPNAQKMKLVDQPTNQRIDINQQQTPTLDFNSNTNSNAHWTLTDKITYDLNKSRFNQFNRERLMYKMNTQQQPAIASVDINGDGILDLFIGGAKNQKSQILISSQNGFSKMGIDDDPRSEVVNAEFFDADNDGDLDLYVAHGGTAFPPITPELNDRLYINDDLNFTFDKQAISFKHTISSEALDIADIDNDGDLDIVIGDSNSNEAYGTPGHLYLFKNDGTGQFKLEGQSNFLNLGVIKKVKVADLDQDAQNEIIVIGEWMPIMIFKNIDGNYVDRRKDFGLDRSRGMWTSLHIADFNGDDQLDIFAGNVGMNAGITTQHNLCIGDFDANGSKEQILCIKEGSKNVPVLDMDELFSQLPHLKKQFVRYQDYAQKSMQDLFENTLLNNSSHLSLDVVGSQIWLNTDGQLKPMDLPSEVQYSSLNASYSGDFDNDGDLDFIVGGNHYLVKPQFGRNDASQVWYLEQYESNDIPSFKCHALNISGELRDIEKWNDSSLVLGLNGKDLHVIKPNFNE